MELFNSTTKELLLTRLEKRYEQGRLIDVYQIDPDTGIARHLTPEQQIEEARKGTPIGEEILYAEKRFMDELKRRM